MLARELRHREGVEPVDARLIAGLEKFPEEVPAGRGIDRPLGMRRAEVQRRPRGDDPFIVRLAGKREREGVEIALPRLARQGDERRRINTAAEEDADRRIADEVMRDRIDQRTSSRLDRLGVLRPIRKLQVPVAMRATAAVLPGQRTQPASRHFTLRSSVCGSGTVPVRK